MEKSRKPMSETNMSNVAFLSVLFAPLTGAITEDLEVFIVSVLTIPVVLLLLYVLWLRYGHSGIHLNSINVFVMLTMLSVYSTIPLFSIIWGTWLAWLSILIHVMTFIIGFINRKKLIRIISGTSKSGKKKHNTFVVYYGLGVFILGIVGIVVLSLAIEADGDAVYVFSFFHLLSFYLFAISPAFLVKPERALEMGVISQSHYDNYH